jgi:hypothetical protein
MMRNVLLEVIRDLPLGIHAPIFWALATCSRMSDIRDLKKRNLFNYALECILVHSVLSYAAARRLQRTGSRGDAFAACPEPR